MPPPLIINGKQGTQAPFLSVNGGTSAPPPQPSFMSKVGGAIVNYAKQSAGTIGNVVNAVSHPIQTLQKLPSLFIDPLMQGEKTAGDALYNIVSNKNPDGFLKDPQKIADVSNFLTGLASSALAPIAGLSSIAEKLPVLNNVNDAMNLVFKGAGLAGSYPVGKIIDMVPMSVLPQTSKDIIKQPLQNLASLGSQVVLGGAIMDKVNDYVMKGKVVTPEIATTIVDKSKVETQNHPFVQTENPPPLNINNSVPPDTSPVENASDTGTQTKPPEIAPLNTSTGPETKVSSSVDTITEPTSEKTVGRTTQSLKPIEGTGETKARGLSQGVEAKAIENKLANNFGDLPEYKTVSMSDQAQRASDILGQDYESAKSIAMGEKAPPKGTLPESVFVAVENKAISEGDVQTLQDLANSKLSASATTMGQRIRTLGERDPTSPVGAIQEVQKARSDALAQKDVAKQTQDTVKEIQDSIKNVKTTKETWNSFVDSITC